MRINEIFKKASGLAGIGLLRVVTSTQAASFSVTTTADSGAGSLRQAIVDATANAVANDITFNIPTSDPGFDLLGNNFTIGLFSQLPDLPLAPLSIDNGQPQSVTINGNNSFRIFTLVNSAVVTMNNLTISNGSSGSAGVRSRLLGFPPDFGQGGGIYMGDSSTLNLSRSTISSNLAGNGGGIFINNSGTLNIDLTTINGNVASEGSGGGIFNNTAGTVNATSGTIDSNSASNLGGGIYNGATMTITSNTITRNTASLGGGAYNNATATLNNVLVAENTAINGRDLFGGSGLGGVAFTGTYDLIGILDDSVGLESSPNRSGSVISPLDPMLGPLQNNGGSTLTRALLTGSPAIDKGNSPVILADQRGRPCPVDNATVPNDGGNGADIGSFEFQLAPTAAKVSISGQVVDQAGHPVTNAWVSLNGTQGIIARTVTSSFGRFRFNEVPSGSTYVVTVNSGRYSYAPKVMAVNEAITDLTFWPISESGKNSEAIAQGGDMKP